MKNPIILILCVGLLVAASFIYRYEKTSPFSGFPVAGALKKVEKDAPVLLFVFFSRNTCRPCLGFFSLLNQTQDQWPVLGLIPHKEFADAEEIRKLTGAEFPIDSMKKYRRFTPLVNPTIVGV